MCDSAISPPILYPPHPQILQLMSNENILQLADCRQCDHSPLLQGTFAQINSFLTDEYQGLTFAGEAFDVKVSGLNTEYFTFTWLPTLVAVDDRLFRGVVRLLRMGHCKTKKYDLNKKSIFSCT